MLTTGQWATFAMTFRGFGNKMMFFFCSNLTCIDHEYMVFSAIGQCGYVHAIKHT